VCSRGTRLKVAARVCIAGVGAVGSTIAARLSDAGETVSLLARGARLAQLRRDGLRVDFPDRSTTTHLYVSDRPDCGVQDIVFVATKAQGLAALLPALVPIIGPQTVVVPLVNGIPWWYFQKSGDAFTGSTVAAVDPEATLCGAVDIDRIVGCVVYMTAQLKLSGAVSVMGGQRLMVGEPGNGLSPRVSALTEMLARAGITAKASATIRDDLWTKVALNLATNPLSVVAEATLLEQFTDPRLLPVVTAVLEETRRVAAAYGATPTMSLDEMLATGRKAGPFETSMLQDFRAGRPLELDAIGASVLELAEKIGEQMPVTRLIVDLCAHRAASRGRPAP
jgi:2-dehydropantoate 2-reductase